MSEIARTISGETHDEERAMYNLEHAAVEDCVFEGPADGESALKECRDITVKGCTFALRYPVWHADGFSLDGCVMTDTCRAPLWYCRNGRISFTEVNGVKCLRECDHVSLDECRMESPEFGWKCRNICMEGCGLVSEYMFLDSSGIGIASSMLRGKYGFQYCSGVTIRDSTINTKDAFWHSRDVTVEDCEVAGEYLGWYSENLTLVRCHIKGTQPLCYCKGLRLIDCTMEGTDLAFEYSDVDAEVRGHIDSVKNPRSGRIHAGSIGGIVLGDQVMDCHCEIVADIVNEGE